MNHTQFTPSSPTLQFSLVIPTLNERENIIQLITALQQELIGLQYEIIVADDNSPDGTAALVEDYSKSHPQIVLIKRLQRQGLSAAVIDGFDHARGKYLGVMDADLSHDPKILTSLIAALDEGANLAVGSRRVPGGGADHWPWFRRMYSNLSTMIARTLLRIDINDPMSGYFVLRKNVFDTIRPILNPKGYKILLEIATRSQEKNTREIPFIFIDRKQGHSKLTTKIALQYFQMLWDLRSYFSFMHWLRFTYHTGRYKKVVRRLKPGKTLDIGCGQPCETMPEQAFLRFLDRKDSVGLDIKPMSGPFEFKQGSITAIPFPDQTFDNVVAMEVIEHITEVDQALDEICRVLKVGGTFVMSTPDCHPVWEFFWHRWTKVIGQMWHDAHVISLTPKDLHNILSKRFRVVAFERHWFFDLVFTCVREK